MLSLALPKGSLEEQTILLFNQADMTIGKSSRAYNPTVDDPRISRTKILRPQEIPIFVQDGYFDIGISGHDWVQESGADVVEVAELPYAKTGTGFVRMVLAVPDDSPVESARDIRPGSRITTEFPKATKQFFDGLGIEVEVFFSYGATEAKVPEMMDALVDLTETGSTLRRNGLKIVDTILTSTTRLVANKGAWADPVKRAAIEEVRTLLLGVIEARGKVLLSMNVASRPPRGGHRRASRDEEAHGEPALRLGGLRDHHGGREEHRQRAHPAPQGRGCRGHPGAADQQDRALGRRPGQRLAPLPVIVWHTGHRSTRGSVDAPSRVVPRVRRVDMGR